MAQIFFAENCPNFYNSGFLGDMLVPRLELFEVWSKETKVSRKNSAVFSYILQKLGIKELDTDTSKKNKISGIQLYQ